MAIEGRQPAGDDRPSQPLRRGRQVARHAEAAEALPQRGPAAVLAQQLAADEFRIADDVVLPKVHQVGGLIHGRIEARQRLVRDRRAAPRAATIQEQHTKLLERALQPTGVRFRPRCAEAWPALEEHQPGQVGLLLPRDHNLAREDADLLTSGPGVIERDDEFVLPEHEIGKLRCACVHGSNSSFVVRLDYT